MKQGEPATRRIGIFGGTFDPPHLGHLRIAEAARRQVGLSMVVFVPAYLPPHKRRKRSTPAQHRLAMLRVALKGRKSCRISNVEFKRRGVSYTIDTVNSFARRFRGAGLFLIIGSDNFDQFRSWKRPREILRRVTPVVYARRRDGRGKRARRRVHEAIWLKGNLIKISSSDIRSRVARGKSIRALVPQRVLWYIGSHKLYE